MQELGVIFSVSRICLPDEVVQFGDFFYGCVKLNFVVYIIEYQHVMPIWQFLTIFGSFLCKPRVHPG